MTLQQFVDKYLGQTKGYPTDSQYLGQCLSIVKLYIKECFGISPPASGSGSAYGYWSNFPSPLGTVFKKVENTPDLIPEYGWIVIWEPWTGNTYGHIAIVDKDCTKTVLKNIAQNWSSKVFQRETQNYNNVKGFLVPLQTTNNNMSDNYKGLDLTNRESMKVAVDVWADVRDGKYVKKEELEEKVTKLEAQKAVIQVELSKTQDNLKEANAKRVKAENDLKVKQTELDKLNDTLADERKDWAEAEKKHSDMVDELVVQINKLENQQIDESKLVAKFLDKVIEGLDGYTGEKTIEGVKNSISQREADRNKLKIELEELKNNPLIRLILIIKGLIK